MAKSLRFVLVSLVVALIVAPMAAVRALERGAVFLFDLIVPSPDKRDFRLAVDAGPALELRGLPVDPALQQSLRHEAGFRRRTASRGG